MTVADRDVISDGDLVIGDGDLACVGVNAKAPVVADDSISAAQKLAQRFRRVVVFVMMAISLVLMGTSGSCCCAWYDSFLTPIGDFVRQKAL